MKFIMGFNHMKVVLLEFGLTNCLYIEGGGLFDGACSKGKGPYSLNQTRMHN